MNLFWVFSSYFYFLVSNLSGPGADKLFSLLIAARTSSILMLLLLAIKSLELIISLSLFSKLILKLSSKLFFDFDLSMCVSLSIFDISGSEKVYLFCPVCNGSTMFLPLLFCWIYARIPDYPSKNSNTLFEIFSVHLWHYLWVFVKLFCFFLIPFHLIQLINNLIYFVISYGFHKLMLALLSTSFLNVYYLSQSLGFD